MFERLFGVLHYRCIPHPFSATGSSWQLCWSILQQTVCSSQHSPRNRGAPYIGWNLQSYDNCNLVIINLNPLFRNLMSQEDTLCHGQKAFLCLQRQSSPPTSLEGLSKVLRVVGCAAIDTEVIYEHFHKIAQKVIEDDHHSSLEGGRCIA